VPSQIAVPETPLLELRNVTRRYPGRVAVEAASFGLQSGSVACLLGPSGCGKSTLLRMIAGLEPVDGGEILIGGVRMSNARATLAPEHRGVGLVFQDNALFPHLDVRDNVGFGLSALTADIRAERVGALLARFHIDHLAKAWPHMLSGGEQQRVAIARALARSPSLLLLDEPFSGLDGDLRAAVRQSLLADLRAIGTTVLVVTHDPEEAMMIADNLVLMSAGQVLQTGNPEHCYRQPTSVAAARLLGDALILAAAVKDGAAQTILGPVSAKNIPDGPAEAVIRPEALRLESDGVAATIVSVHFAGNAHIVHLKTGGLDVTMRHSGVPPVPGDTVSLSINADAAHIFSAKAQARPNNRPPAAERR
jgi:iron(III) transport system ATP-binding protein